MVPPPYPTDILLEEHLTCPLSSVRHPLSLDLSHPNFKLRDLNDLSELRDGVLRDLNADGNELVSLEVINRFSQLRTLQAARNRLQIGGGMVLRLPRLTELDVSRNRLVAVPPLDALPQLQVLRLQRNEISRNWSELQVCGALREVDVSRNRLQWIPGSREFDESLKILTKLKRLRELRFAHNPVAETPAVRYLLISHAPRLEWLDGLQVTEQERRGKLSQPPPVALLLAPMPLDASADPVQPQSPSGVDAPMRAVAVHSGHLRNRCGADGGADAAASSGESENELPDWVHPCQPTSRCY